MRGKSAGGWLGLTALVLILTAVPAQAATQASDDQRDRRQGRDVERRPAVASFEGRSIDLAGDWGEARACLVWRQGGVLECFRTPEAMEAREAQLGARRGVPAPDDSSGDVQASFAAYSYSCSSPLRLFDYFWYGGRQLVFYDRGYWQNLWDYGFDDRASSYIVGGCYAHLAEHPDGGGWWYPGPTYPYAGEGVMYGGWANVTSSIYIE